MNQNLQKCDICGQKSNNTCDVLIYGDWKQKSKINVHYYCLLLSTNLPKNGEETSGILGFYISDIRREIAAATQRQCSYCNRTGASIACKKCLVYFHRLCGLRNFCLFQFAGNFDSYCSKCAPILDKYEELYSSQIFPNTMRCYICKDIMGAYGKYKWIYGPCCGNGFVHRVCMQEYALAAGYYLKCIWCRDVEFRNQIRLRGIHVPDSDATWEREKGAYRDLHRGHSRCSMDVCNCPKGREYITTKWTLILCSLCGLVGAHNPFCIPNVKNKNEKVKIFKCSTCINVEQHLTSRITNKSLCDDSNADSDSSENSVLTVVNALMNKSRLAENIANVTINSIDVGTTLNSAELNTENAQQSTIKKNNDEAITMATENELQADNFVVDGNSSGDNLIRENLATNAPVDAIELEFAELFDGVQAEVSNNICNMVENITIEPLHTATIEEEMEEDKMAECEKTKQSHSEIESEKKAYAQLVVNKNPIASSLDTLPSTSKPAENFVTFQAFRFNGPWPNCVGTCTIRVNILEPRFSGKSLQEIEHNLDYIEERDIIAFTTDIGIMKDVYKIIEEEIGSFSQDADVTNAIYKIIAEEIAK